MATNQTMNVRTILAPIADINTLTDTQILQLIQSETTAGAQADVGGLQVGDLVAITPNNIGTIDELHGDVVAGEEESAKRIFMVLSIGGVPGSVPERRHVLAELFVTNTLFW